MHLSPCSRTESPRCWQPPSRGTASVRGTRSRSRSRSSCARMTDKGVRRSCSQGLPHLALSTRGSSARRRPRRPRNTDAIRSRIPAARDGDGDGEDDSCADRESSESLSSVRKLLSNLYASDCRCASASSCLLCNCRFMCSRAACLRASRSSLFAMSTLSGARRAAAFVLHRLPKSSRCR